MATPLEFGWVGEHLPAILNGVATTTGLIAATVVLGLGLSILGAVARRSGSAWLRVPATFYVEFIRNTPFIAQLFFIFFGLPSLGLRLDALTAAVLAMTLNLGAYGTEIVRAGLDAVAPGQREAGSALGMGAVPVFLVVVLPQALRNVFPALASQIVITMLDSAVLSQIAVRDLTYEADLIQSRTFRAFETYLLVACIYLALSILLRRVLGIAGRRLLGRDTG